MWERLKFIGSSIFDFCLPFMKQMMKASGPILAKAALAAVKIVAAHYQGKTSNEKRDAALDIVISDLKSQGIVVGKDIGMSLVNTALEVAYQKFKESSK